MRGYRVVFTFDYHTVIDRIATLLNAQVLLRLQLTLICNVGENAKVCTESNLILFVLFISLLADI